jgi:uncharacterized protein (TIGR02678 family)
MIDDEQMALYAASHGEPDLAWEGEDEEQAEEQLPRAAFTYHTSRDLFQGHAALLDNVTVSLQTQPDVYRLVRAHLPALERWHEQHTGWRVQRGSNFFRLERHLAGITPVYLDDKLKRPRDFVCLTWLLWFAEKRHLAGGGRNQQFLLSQLADELQQQSQEVPGGPALDFRNQQDRYSMWRALDYLTRLGGLQTLEGEIKKWAEDAAQQEGEVLYEFTPIAHSLIEALNEERVAASADLLRRQREQLLPPGVLSPAASAMPPLIRAWRALMLGPVLLRYDDPEAFAALIEQAEEVSDELARAFGWLLELNDDYACVVRGSTLSAGAGPGLTISGAYDHMLLLLCTAFREQVEQQTWQPDGYGCLRVSHWDIIPLFNELRQRYGSYWGASVRESKAAELLEEVYQRMRLLGLLRGPDAEGQMLILPTAARYSVSYQQQDIPEERPKARPASRATKKQASAARPTFDWSAGENV